MAKNVGSKSYQLTLEADGYYRTRPPQDTTPPTLNGLPAVSDVTASGFTVSFPAATDTQSGVASYDVQVADNAGFSGATTYPTTATALGISNLTAGLWYVRYRATDGNGNVAGWSAATTQSVSAATSIRFAPGHYMRGGNGDSAATWVSNINGWTSAIRGGHIYVYWKDLETAEGVYNWGTLDTVFDACAARGKTLFIRLNDKRFGSTDPSDALPQYLLDAGLTYYRTTPQLTAGAKLWNSTCMDHAIRVCKAILARYKDQGTTLVGLSGQETVLGGTLLNLDGSNAGYSASAYSAQEVRRLQELRAYAPEISWFIASSWFSGDTNARAAMTAYFAAARADKGVLLNGGSDMLVNASGSSGTSDGFETLVGTYGGVDARDDYMVNGNTDADDRNLRSATLDTIYNKAYTTYGANYMFWLNATYNGISWSDIMTYAATHPMNSTVPTQLTGLVTQV